MAYQNLLVPGDSSVIREIITSSFRVSIANNFIVDASDREYSVPLTILEAAYG